MPPAEGHGLASIIFQTLYLFIVFVIHVSMSLNDSVLNPSVPRRRALNTCPANISLAAINVTQKVTQFFVFGCAVAPQLRLNTQF